MNQSHLLFEDRSNGTFSRQLSGKINHHQVRKWDAQRHLVGAARYFNVMMARDLMQARVVVDRLRAGAELFMRSEAAINRFFCLYIWHSDHGSARCRWAGSTNK